MQCDPENLEIWSHNNSLDTYAKEIVIARMARLLNFLDHTVL